MVVAGVEKIGETVLSGGDLVVVVSVGLGFGDGVTDEGEIDLLAGSGSIG